MSKRDDRIPDHMEYALLSRLKQIQDNLDETKPDDALRGVIIDVGITTNASPVDMMALCDGAAVLARTLQESTAVYGDISEVLNRHMKGDGTVPPIDPMAGFFALCLHFSAAGEAFSGHLPPTMLQLIVDMLTYVSGMLNERAAGQRKKSAAGVGLGVEEDRTQEMMDLFSRLSSLMVKKDDEEN